MGTTDNTNNHVDYDTNHNNNNNGNTRTSQNDNNDEWVVRMTVDTITDDDVKQEEPEKLSEEDKDMARCEDHHYLP